MSDNKDIPQEPIVAENPEPMEQDASKTVPSVAPVVPTPAEQSSSTQSASGGIGKNFLQKIFGDK
uniref:Signal recognition particle-docking protein FtsY n=2 Tax=Panagrolaimus sp. JU765 TaxID=591449 RepID=A0AC34RGY7_9BILA